MKRSTKNLRHTSWECKYHSEFHGLSEELCGTELLGEGILRVTVGRDEAQIREYIREQEKEDKRLEQLKIFE
jgi:putative transposase